MVIHLAAFALATIAQANEVRRIAMPLTYDF
jgi:hypothetical protein